MHYAQLDPLRIGRPPICISNLRRRHHSLHFGLFDGLDFLVQNRHRDLWIFHRNVPPNPQQASAVLSSTILRRDFADQAARSSSKFRSRSHDTHRGSHRLSICANALNFQIYRVLSCKFACPASARRRIRFVWRKKFCDGP